VDVSQHRHDDAEGGDGQEGFGPAWDLGEIQDEDGGLEEHEEHDRARGAEHAPGGEAEQRDHEARAVGGPGEQLRDHARSRTISPRIPWGRKIRMRMRIEKARMSLYSAPKAPPVSSDR